MKQSKIIEPPSHKTLIVARSGYGKTFICIELLKGMIKKKELAPTRLVIFSQTIRSEPKQLEFVQWMQKQCPKDYDYAKENTSKEIKYQFLEMLYNQQMAMKESGIQYYGWCIWFDDQMSEEEIRHGVHPILKKLAFQGRHYGISTIWNFQSYRQSIDSTIREQTTRIILGDLNSDEHKYDVIKQFASGVDKDDPKKSGLKLFQKYTEILEMNNRHGFLTINNEKSLGEGRFEIGVTGEYIDQDFIHTKQNGTADQRQQKVQKRKEGRKEGGEAQNNV